MKRILILGGGFVGSNLARELIKKENKVKILSRTNPNINGTQFVEINWPQIVNYEDEFENIDIVIHTISTTVPSNSNLDIVRDVEENIVTNIKLFDIMVKYKISKHIFISSGGAIYGFPNNEVVTEKHSTHPISSYGISKLTTEKYIDLYNYTYGLNSIILRPSNLYGQGQSIQKPQGAIGHIVNSINLNKEFEIWGDGLGKKDYLHISDMINAILTVIESEFVHLTAMNISSGELYSLLDIIHIIEKITSKKLKLNYKPQKSFDVTKISIDNSLFMKTFDWKPKITLKQGIAELINS